MPVLKAAQLGSRVDGLMAYPLLGFEEKPTEARARELINLPGVAWNAGMFAWQRGAIRAALEKYTPLPMLIDQAVGSDLALAGAAGAAGNRTPKAARRRGTGR